MSAVATITASLLAHVDVLALPRWRVIADVRSVFGCSDYAARTAYARARVMGHRRDRRSTSPHERAAA